MQLRSLSALIALAVILGHASGAPPESRVARLARGVNISHWFWLAPDLKPGSVRAFVSPEEVDRLKAAGITHARIPVEPDYIYDESAHTLRVDNLAEYRRGLELFTSRSIAVIVDPHPNQTEWVKHGTDDFTLEYVKFWSALARALADTPADLVFFEVMNEPHGYTEHAVWPAAQAECAAAIRAAAPEHTIIATGDDWGGIKGLVRLKPLPDGNVIYSFHYYDPMTFTHQGATWGAANWKHLRDVPYPATPGRIHESMEKIDDESARNEVRRYGDQGWGRRKIREDLAVAAAWSVEHGVPVYCGEFGAIRANAAPQDRAAWLKDVTGSLDDLRIGYAMWDYAGGFALATGEPGHRTLDPQTAAAIGLKP